ncbi:glycosyltransferase family 2 protein [Oligoflexus tunisiensis]|uniref:glycosyltransferase family 2 protein n=1 Tax=Oligoflexus tunisiensis TaxID=708132 RepID=UPI001C404AC3|nr:glycosyltransferase [Oligoflexus tunisiensis]
MSLKLYEYVVRLIGCVGIDYFCKAFESTSLPEKTSAFVGLHILIPFRDRWDLTRICLEALRKQNLGQISCHVHLIDNGSSPGTRAQIRNWLQQERGSPLEYTVHEIDEPFNFSRLCNLGLKLSRSLKNQDLLLFLNNDVVLENSNSLAQSAAFVSQTSGCGAVGITLLFPNRRIQHVFAAPGVKIVAAHPFKGRHPSILREWKMRARQVPAVTGAFLLLSAENFLKVGGFDENLPTAGQDIDLCLKLQKAGLKNWVLPHIEAVHWESASRKHSRINFDEVRYIYSKWRSFLTQNPEYPVNISRFSEQPARVFWKEGDYPIEKLRSVRGKA